MDTEKQAAHRLTVSSKDRHKLTFPISMKKHSTIQNVIPLFEDKDILNSLRNRKKTIFCTPTLTDSQIDTLHLSRSVPTGRSIADGSCMCASPYRAKVRNAECKLARFAREIEAGYAFRLGFDCRKMNDSANRLIDDIHRPANLTNTQARKWYDKTYLELATEDTISGVYLSTGAIAASLVRSNVVGLQEITNVYPSFDMYISSLSLKPNIIIESVNYEGTLTYTLIYVIDRDIPGNDYSLVYELFKNELTRDSNVDRNFSPAFQEPTFYIHGFNGAVHLLHNKCYRC